MGKNEGNTAPVLVADNNRLAYSISVCLLQAGHTVVLYTKNKDKAAERVNLHWKDLLESGCEVNRQHPVIKITDKLEDKSDYELIIAITSENLAEKKALIGEIEKRLPADAVIAVNTESISLDTLQEGCNYPDRIIGVNWVEPAHTTLFLEVITNNITGKQYTDRLLYLAKEYWHKDPYVISGGLGIRSRMFAAMAREAFYLIENGYASVKDIDRACRNDAGYYLPFAGNCRYMDLMGAYVYGLVMKELSPDLSKSRDVPAFFNDIVTRGGTGMDSGRGFYQYHAGEAEKWDKMCRKFSYQIRQIMDKYPFNYTKENS